MEFTLLTHFDIDASRYALRFNLENFDSSRFNWSRQVCGTLSDDNFTLTTSWMQRYRRGGPGFEFQGYL